jgi:PelA/Pel-15E family pectate lyase
MLIAALAHVAGAQPSAPSAGTATAARPVPSRDAALAAMKRATVFMTETVAYRGGYVWNVTEDLTRRWGEIPARFTQIWVQQATPETGELLLDAFAVTHDRYYLDAARKAADALIFGQHPLGGWHYFVDFDPKGVPTWYETTAKHFRFGYEEYRHFYGNATFDDGNTANAGRFLLRFYATTMEPAYRGPAVKAADFLLLAQYPNGAWPQRFPLRYEFAHDGLPDYTSFYTLNDGAAAANVELLVAAYQTLGDQRYLDAAKRGVDFMIAVQGPMDQAGWAEQYGPDMKPAAARTHEPAGYVIRESRQVVEWLERFFLMTGDRRYLRPIPACLDWFERVNREALANKWPAARYYQPGTNLPVYVTQTRETNAEGYGLYTWSTTPPAGGDVRQAVDVAPLRAEFERVSKLTPEQARSEYEKRFGQDIRRPDPPAEFERRIQAPVERIVGALDARGAWVEDGIRVLIPNYKGEELEPRETIRGISTHTYIRNMRRLIAFVAEGR